METVAIEEETIELPASEAPAPVAAEPEPAEVPAGAPATSPLPAGGGEIAEDEDAFLIRLLAMM